MKRRRQHDNQGDNVKDIDLDRTVRAGGTTPWLALLLTILEECDNTVLATAGNRFE